MGKSKKKSATKVAVAPDAAATKPLNKGKREAEEATGNQQVPAKKQKQDVAALKQAIAKMKAEAKNPNNTKAESNSEGDADADDSGLDDETKLTAVSSKGENDASDGKSGVESGDKSDEMPKVAEAEEDGSSEEEGSEEEISESEEGDKKAPKPNVKKAGKTPSTPQAAATGGKTLFMGNIPSSVKESDVEEFFKDAGEIAEVRLASNREGKFKGFGHVEFATVEAAQEALQLNGGDFLGRQIKLDMAREKGAYTPASTPASGNENSNQKGGKAQGQTVYVRGFDTSDSEEQVRSALEKHFGSCGDIHRVSIPQKDGGLKGMAYVEFSFSDCIDKALKLNGSKLGGAQLTVEEAKPKEGSGHSGGRGRGRSDGGGGRGRFGGGGRSGGRFGGDSGGRFGGGGRRGGRRGGRGRGRY